MFSWLRRKRANKSNPEPAPAKIEASASEGAEPERIGENPANPGFTASGQIAFSNGERTWEERFDCVAILRQVLESAGRQVRLEGDVIFDEESGISLRPLVAGFEPIHLKGIKTTTTIEVKHPSAIREAIFEYQHSTGDSTEASIREGFDQWRQTDLVALVAAVTADPRDCLVMKMEFPPEGARPGMKRRVIFGPVAHMRQHVVEKEELTEGGHAFCPCCLLTRCLDAFKPIVESRGLYALRLFAMRGASGEADADCRVNGEDFDAGKVGLKKYVESWPQAGVEFRKQYVIVQDATEGDWGSEEPSAEPPGAEKELELAGV